MASPFTFHVVALPHTEVSAEFIADAYQQKVFNFCRMMMSRGHKVILYSSGATDAPCTEHVQVMTTEERLDLYGRYDHGKEFFKLEWDPEHLHWTQPNGRTIKEMDKRLGDKDFICVIGGRCHKAIADAFDRHQTVEFGIGYSGVFSNYRVFESYSWMHWVLGSQGIDDGRFYDAVIPNYFDPEHFPGPAEPADYYLFMGRLIDRKGWRIAVEVTERLGAKLLMAGQIGDADLSGLPPHVEHVGLANRERRAELMSHAKAVFVPTTYVEPFGGVNVEAMMCGTPVIATDWGAFTETVVHGVTGYRFRTLGEAVWATQQASTLDRQVIRDYAIANYSLDRVADLYEAYFEQLSDLWGEGWYSMRHTGLSVHNRYGKVAP